MGFELNQGAMKDVHGKFYESEVFDQLDKEAVETFNKEFEPLTKRYYPCQWKE